MHVLKVTMLPFSGLEYKPVYFWSAKKMDMFVFRLYLSTDIGFEMHAMVIWGPTPGNRYFTQYRFLPVNTGGTLFFWNPFPRAIQLGWQIYGSVSHSITWRRWYKAPEKTWLRREVVGVFWYTRWYWPYKLSSSSSKSKPTNTKRNVGLMLAQRRGRWANIKSTLV